MKKRILIMILWGFPLCFCGGAEFPEHSFAPIYNECFTVEDYESDMVGSKERPFDNDGFFAWVLDAADLARIQLNPEWPSYVDPEYWDEFKENYPQYWDDVEEYFEQNPNAPNNPFRLSLIDDIGAIIGMILMGIAYGVFAYRVRRE